MSSYSDSVKLCRGVKAMQRLRDDSAMDGAKIWSCYWIWLQISKWVRERFPLFLRARLNIFTSGGIVYTSKVFLPKGPLMLGFNKVFYCLKKYCLFELFIIPLDRSSTVASVRRDGIIHVFLHFVLQVGFFSFLFKWRKGRLVSQGSVWSTAHVCQRTEVSLLHSFGNIFKITSTFMMLLRWDAETSYYNRTAWTKWDLNISQMREEGEVEAWVRLDCLNPPEFSEQSVIG